jgi:hypothetical protein
MGFKYYLDIGDVEKVSKDQGLSSALIEDAESRLAFAKSVVDQVTIKEENAKYIFEANYDILRTCAECLMKADGYNIKSAKYP